MRYKIEEESILPKVFGLIFVLFMLGVVGEMDYQDQLKASQDAHCEKGSDGVKVCQRKPQ